MAGYRPDCPVSFDQSPTSGSGQTRVVASREAVVWVFHLFRSDCSKTHLSVAPPTLASAAKMSMTFPWLVQIHRGNSWDAGAVGWREKSGGSVLARNLLIEPLQLLSDAYDGKFLKTRSTIQALLAHPNQTKFSGQFGRLRRCQMATLYVFDSLCQVSGDHRD